MKKREYRIFPICLLRVRPEKAGRRNRRGRRKVRPKVRQKVPMAVGTVRMTAVKVRKQRRRSCVLALPSTGTTIIL